MKAAAITWRGRRGSVLLGPTQDRVARYLAARTRFGRVTIRTVDIAAELRLERSEAYRILARLRELGLFGVASDRGGTIGGRRIWRTATIHDGPGLDAARHRSAWRRLLGWGRRRSAAVGHAIAALRDVGRRGRAPEAVRPAELEAGPGDPPVRPASSEFAAAMLRHGLGPLIATWKR